MKKRKVIWKWIVGYRGLYKINNNGKIISVDRIIKDRYHINGIHKKKSILNAHVNKNGYLQVCLTKNSKSKWFRVHRLVGIHFIPNPKHKPCINHKKGNKKDNRDISLEWSTYSENELHSCRTLGKKHYQKPGASHFNSKPVIRIDPKNNQTKEYPNSKIAAKRLNICIGNLSSALSGRRKTTGGYKWKFKKNNHANR